MTRNKNNLGEEVLIQIGKNGFGDAQITEITKNLKANKNVKVKMLKNFLQSNDKKEIVEIIKQKLSSQKNIEIKTIGNVMKIRKTKV